MGLVALGTLYAMVATAKPLKVAALAWSATGVETSTVEVYQERFATLLGEAAGVSVITQRDISQVIGNERQKQLLGCNDESGCMTELTSALGADVLLSGTIARTESFFVISLRGVNAQTGQPFATASARLHDEGELFNWIEQEARVFAERLRAAFDAWVDSRNVKVYHYRKGWLAGSAAAALAGIAGGVFYGVSRVLLRELTSLPVSAIGSAREATLISTGQPLQDSGVALMVAGGVVLVATLLVFFLTRTEIESVTSLEPVPLERAVAEARAF